MTAVLYPTLISEYNFCNVIYIFNMGYINFMQKVINLAARCKERQEKNEKRKMMKKVLK